MYRVTKTLLRWIVILAVSGIHSLAIAEENPSPNFGEHIAPIFRSHCGGCHNAQKKRGGLSLASYADVMAGGAGGEVVMPGDPDNSRLWLLISHEDQPAMPPEQDPIASELQITIKTWIEQGAIEKAGDQAKPRRKTWAYQPPAVSGEAIMPQPNALLMEPVVASMRPAAIAAVACSPVAPLLAISGQQQVVLYDLNAQHLLGILPYPGGSPLSLRFSADGAILAVGGGHHAQSGWAQLFDVKTGELISIVGQLHDVVMDVDLSPGLQRIALGGPTKILQTLRPSGELVHAAKKHNNWILAIAMSPDGKYLASADRNGGLFVCEANTLREVHRLTGHKGAVEDLAWRTDSKLFASAGRDGTVRIWDVENGKQIRSIAAHDAAHSVWFANDGRIATCGQDRNVKIWDANGQAIRTFGPMGDMAMTVAVGHDNTTIVAGDWQGNVVQWNIADGQEVARFASNPQALRPQLAEAEKALIQADQRSAKFSEQFVKLQREIDAAAAQYQVALDEAEATNDELARLSEVAIEATTQSIDDGNADLPGQLQAARLTADKVAEDLRASVERRTDLTSQINQLAADKLEAEKALAQMRSRRDRLQDAVKRQAQRNQALVAEKSAAEELVASTQQHQLQLESLLQQMRPVNSAIDSAQRLLTGPDTEVLLGRFRHDADATILQIEEALEGVRNQSGQALGRLQQSEWRLELFHRAYPAELEAKGAEAANAAQKKT